MQIQSLYDEMSFDAYCYAIESRSIARPVVAVDEGDNSSDENESIAVSDGPDESGDKSPVHDDGSDKNKNKSSEMSNKAISIVIVLVVGVLVV